MIKYWNIEELTGYKPITTFHFDFSFAEHYGYDMVKDTFDYNFETAKNMGYKWLTEFVMVLNWKVWEHSNTNSTLAKLYDKLLIQADEYASENLNEEELSYYYTTTN